MGGLYVDADEKKLEEAQKQQQPEQPLSPFEERLTAFEELIGLYNPEILNAQFQGLTQEQIQGANQGLTDLSGMLGGINTGYQNVLNQLQRITPTGLQGAQTGTASLANILQSRATGGIDPRLQQLATSQLNQLNTQQGQQLAAQSEFFSRRGLGGSAAELNAQNQLGNQFSQQQQNLLANIGATSLNREDVNTQQALSALQSQGNLGLAGAQFQQGLAALQGQYGLQNAQFQQGIYGQQAGLYQQQLANQQLGVESANAAQQARLEAITAGLENAGIPSALLISQKAAETAGEGGGGGGKK